MAVDQNLLGKSLTSNDYSRLAGQIGLGPDLPGGKYNVGGYTYNVMDTGDGRRTINREVYAPTLNDIGGSMVDFAKGLNADQNNMFKEYLDVAQSQESPLDLYRRFLDETGVNQIKGVATTLQGQIYDLEDAIGQAKSNIAATTKNSFVTEGQRAGMVEARRAPLLENLGDLSRDYGRVQDALSSARSDATTLTGLSVQGNELALRPYEKQLEMASDQAARLMTGFSADRQAQLDILLNKLSREQALEDREWELANKLAAEEREFSRQKDIIKMQASGSESGLMSLSEGTTLYDPATRQVVYKAPKTYQSSGGGSGGITFNSKPPSSSGWEIVGGGSINSLWGR